MAIVSLRGISVSFGGPPVLEGISLGIDAGERVCLVGRNGEGKSSLLKVIDGDLLPDGGQILKGSGIRTARLSQGVPAKLDGTVFEVVSSGLGEVVELLSRHRRITAGLESGGGEALLGQLERVHHDLDAGGGWRAHQRVETVLSRLRLDADAAFSDLSGGLMRRVLLARALVSDPDLLLLDEPTNHLDFDAITWLEEFLASSRQALLFVTHDRMLIRRLATRILDLDRGRLTSWPGDYDTYLRRKGEALHAEASESARADRRQAQEEVWIRQGIKARRTRNEGRVRALEKMRRERAERRERIGTARMELQDSEASGKLVVEARDLSFRYGPEKVIDGCSITIRRGDKVGLIGPNASGKTTLLRLLLGDLQPLQGTVRRGANLRIAYFDQHRAQIDDAISVGENVTGGGDFLTVNGRRRHVVGYLQDFLFSPDRVRSPARVLSGGERNRLLLARLFSRPANVLVLDEPTNDLDMETLDLLEELLFEFTGTVLLVSHDRAFLNNVVTSTLAFEGGGTVREYVGGYDDWLRQRPPAEPGAGRKKPGKKPRRRNRDDRPRTLSFKEKRELEGLPEEIEALEREQGELYTAMADPAFYQDAGKEVVRTTGRLAELERLIDERLSRWEALETIREGSA
jgi:ATP-binding cassette subfamily F protein uup